MHRANRVRIRESTQLLWHTHCVQRRQSSALLICVVLYVVRLFCQVTAEGSQIVVDLATLMWHNYRTFTFNTLINEIICLFWLIKWTRYFVLGLFPSICENFHKLRAHVNFLLAHFVLTTALKLKIGEMLNASCSVHMYIGRAIPHNAQCSAKFSLNVRPAVEVRAKCNNYA